jgi:hypothetical protein
MQPGRLSVTDARTQANGAMAARIHTVVSLSNAALSESSGLTLCWSSVALLAMMQLWIARNHSSAPCLSPQPMEILLTIWSACMLTNVLLRGRSGLSDERLDSLNTCCT